MWCSRVAAAVADQTLEIAARERLGEVEGEELMSESLPRSLLLELLPAQRCWERRHRLLAVVEAEAVILPGPGVVEERTKGVEEAVLVVMTARQTRAAAVLGRLAGQEPTIYWKMVCESWVAGVASSLSAEGGPLRKLMILAVEPRWQPSF